MKNDQRFAVGSQDGSDNGHADGDFFSRHAFHAAHHPHAFFQIDQRHVVRLPRWPWINDGYGMNDATSRCLNPFLRPFAVRPNARRKICFAVSRIAWKGYLAVLQRGGELAFGRNRFDVVHGLGIWGRKASVNWRASE